MATTNEELTTSVEELRQSQEALFELNRDLEERVYARTKALAQVSIEAS